ncbi:MAG: pentapeptide repeat-containing protein [Nostoc sp.]
MSVSKPLLKNGEILELYATGVRDFTGYELYIGGDIYCVSLIPDLSGVKFSGLDLSDSYMENFNLSRANLSRTVFNSVCLDGANLSGAN